MVIRPCEFLKFAIDFELLDLPELSNVSPASTATNAHVLQSADLRILLQRKVEEEGNLESQNLMIDIGFEEMAAPKHSLKIALRVYDELQNSRFVCVQTKSHDRGPQEHWFGLLQVSPRMDSAALCFDALTTVCTQRDDTLAENRCVALTNDGVQAAAMLLSAYRAGAECHLPQPDAAWVRNVIADSESFLPDLLGEVP